MRKLVVFGLLLASVAIQAADSRVVVLPISSQPAAALVDSVRPLVGEDGSVTAYHDKLIVRASAAEIAAVRTLLRELDRPPRRLIIEVRQAGHFSQSIREFDYGVAGDDVRLGRVPPGGGAQLRYRDLSTRGRDDSLQRVQALEGRPALIRAGQSVPVYQTHQSIVGRRLVQGFDMRYRNVTSGFFALPRVHGDQVTVEIYQQHQRPGMNGRFAIQQAATVLRGGIGQWLTLGSTGGADDDRQDAWGRHAQTRRSQDRQLELRVLAVD